MTYRIGYYDAQRAFMNEARPQVYDAVGEDARVPEKGARVNDLMAALATAGLVRDSAFT